MVARMKISRNRSLKTCLAAAGAAAVFVTTLPATASADVVDSALNQIPSGQISCEAAESYWTNESEYESYRSQAAAVAAFHPRGGEINDALARIDEAADRCGLKGGSTPAAEQTTPAENPAVENTTPGTTDEQAADPAPVNNEQAADAQATTENTPGTAQEDETSEGDAPEAPVEQAPEVTPIYRIPVPAGTPTTILEIPGVGPVEIPDVPQVIADLQGGTTQGEAAEDTGETTPDTTTDIEQIITDLQEGNPLAQLALTSSQAQ